MNWRRWGVLAIILATTAAGSVWLWTKGYYYGVICCLFLPFEGLFFNMKRDSEPTYVHHEDAQGL
ncbi:MAG: hypothetical protein QF440_02775 [Candidatus Thalassarchaeaceae archaeon]|jgi:hypothetical protein|nr:hypothetical protein [Candidatus Thalassarchaeaceae archaeon]